MIKESTQLSCGASLLIFIHINDLTKDLSIDIYAWGKLFINETSELNRNLVSVSSWCESVLTAPIPSGDLLRKEQTAYEYWRASIPENERFATNYFRQNKYVYLWTDKAEFKDWLPLKCFSLGKHYNADLSSMFLFFSVYIYWTV